VAKSLSPNPQYIGESAPALLLPYKQPIFDSVPLLLRDASLRFRAGTGADAMTQSFEEPHFSVKQLSERWGFSERTIRRRFAYEPGVVVIEKGVRFKRRYRRIQIPASVAERVHRRMTRV
jgi:hypothetical protein